MEDLEEVQREEVVWMERQAQGEEEYRKGHRDRYHPEVALEEGRRERHMTMRSY